MSSSHISRGDRVLLLRPVERERHDAVATFDEQVPPSAATVAVWGSTRSGRRRSAAATSRSSWSRSSWSRRSCSGRVLRMSEPTSATDDELDGVEVRHVQPYQAVKAYRCPGCDHEIRPGEGHEVVVPRRRARGPRHWHTGCWRPRAPPRTRRASERGFDHVDRRAPCRAPRAPTRRRSAASRARVARVLDEPAQRERAEPLLLRDASPPRRARRTRRCGASSPRRTRRVARARRRGRARPRGTRQLRSSTS